MQQSRIYSVFGGGILLGVLLTLGGLKVIQHVQRTGSLLPSALMPVANATQGKTATGDPTLGSETHGSQGGDPLSPAPQSVDAPAHADQSSHADQTGTAPALVKLASATPAATDPAPAAQAATDGKAQPANELDLSTLSLKPTARLGRVTFAYTITASNKSADAGMQLFVRNQDIAGSDAWKQLSPADASGQPIILHLYHGIDTTGTFVVSLPKGAYREFRLILFASPDGKGTDFGHVVYDTANDRARTRFPLDLNVTSGEAPILAPELDVATASHVAPQGDGNFTVTIPAKVKVPTGYQPEQGGFWAMAKSSAGFSQVWAAMKDGVPAGQTDDPHTEIPIVFTIKDVKPGLWTSQFGLFKYSWGNPLQWVYPGIDFEAGGDAWEQKAPEDRIPPRLMVKDRQFQTLAGTPYAFYHDGAARQAAAFVRGGNYGNAIAWTDQPALDTPGYFTLLRDMGCRYMRLNFNPDRYPDEPVYQHAVDQVVQNIWAAGLYPILAPQDLPKGTTQAERVAKGLRVLRTLAAKYKDRSVWIEVCNEPQEFSSWESWKPVAEKYVKAIREIDPSAFVIVPFENFSKDGRGAAKDPITSVHVDLYDGHAYVKAPEVAALFGPAAKAGLPVLIGEYGGSDPDYLRAMDKAFQDLPPGVLAVSPWAFTVKGQDTLPLIEDGSTATLRYTSTGQAIADDFAKWDAGKKVE